MVPTSIVNVTFPFKIKKSTSKVKLLTPNCPHYHACNSTVKCPSKKER